MTELLSVQTEHGPMTYRSWGRGRPYLLLTASVFGSHEFHGVGESLSLSARAVAPDLPGLGGSAPLDEPSPGCVCESLLTFFALAGLDAMVVCASGVASLPALELVDRHPEYAAGLMLLNPVLTARGAARKPPYLARTSTTALNILGYAQRKAVTELRKLFLDPSVLSDLTEDVARSGLDRTGRKHASAFFDCADPDRFPAYLEALRRFTKPLHVLWSDRDPLVPPSSMHDLTAAVPRARCKLLQETGHFVSLESPSRLGDALAALGREAW